MDRLLRLAFSKLIRHGSLRVTTAAGSVFAFGDGAGPPVAVRFTSAAAEWAVLLDPELRLGETFMDGTFVVEQGSIADFLRLVTAAVAVRYPIPWIQPLVMIRYLARKLAQWNRRGASRRNVAHHYDLDGRLYALFLDSDRQYSCAYVETPDASLDDAQLAKKRHIAAKLLIRPGQRVLDIGSGWGGLALYLAETGGTDVTGLTLSTEQLGVARARARESDLSARVRFRLQDYRDVAETFDRIVSVGMFEHVGVRFYDAYFQAAARALSDDGVMLLHAIGRSEGPAYTNPWIAKYIFPGGYIPALSEVLPAIERAGLLVTDIEILRLHYAETLAAWRRRFLAHRDEALRLYDCRFVRMWEFYLAASEMAFREQNMMVFQIQLAKRQGVVPITRDYMAREEQRLRAAERGPSPPLRLAGE
ncbi:SAM-dependent methyltransferase [Rhodoplanes roseus]|uniref:SAM-dependent methyltransferase n=1 Tax=Rhodoplanes roseus TaxID=29409 RepID=A0A327KH11_9BRAD|nr:cyclopropane-fatty-acyl-phospholipid synthase family protein [Rhodoplanes roseus]RAI36825.1 SAM-dependent methyltransferase [Rhodoplanes roseus]